MSIFALAIGCAVCILDEVDVQSLGILSIVVVGRAIKPDGVDVMSSEEMKFVDVEVLANTEIDENLLILVEATKRIFKKRKGLIGMQWILSKVEGVKNCTRGSYKAHRGLAIREIKVDNQSQQDATDVVVFLPTDT